MNNPDTDLRLCQQFVYFKSSRLPSPAALYPVPERIFSTLLWHHGAEEHRERTIRRTGRTIALEGEMVGRAILLVSMIMAMLLVGSGVALADVFTGTGDPDSYTGPVEDDSITGSGGEDYLQGDPTPFGPGGNDFLSGGDGDDEVYGASGDDYVSGGDGDDNISGTLGSDIVSGGDGDDIVGDGPPFDTGTDIVFGGAGDDIVDAYNEPPHMDTIHCGPGDDLVYTDGLDHLVDCEASILGPEPDPWELRYLN